MSWGGDTSEAPRPKILVIARAVVSFSIMLCWLYVNILMVWQFLHPYMCDDLGCRLLPNDYYHSIKNILFFIASLVEYGLLAFLIWPFLGRELFSRRNLYWSLGYLPIMVLLTNFATVLWDFPQLYIIHSGGLLFSDLLWLIWLLVLIVGLTVKRFSSRG